MRNDIYRENSIAINIDRKLNKNELHYIEKMYYKISGYATKYNSTFRGDKDLILSHLHDIIIKAAVAYYKHDIKNSISNHFHGYVRGYFSNHIRSYKNKGKNKITNLETNIKLSDYIYKHEH